MLARSLSAIQAALPTLTPFSRGIVEAIHLSGGPIGSAATVARRLQVGSRFALARRLKREGLPSLRRLGQWATILSWLIEAETTGASLCRMAFHSGRYPGACYRLVKEVTGLTWEAVRGRGYDWAEREFLRAMGVTNPVLPPLHRVPVPRCRVPTFARLRAQAVAR